MERGTQLQTLDGKNLTGNWKIPEEGNTSTVQNTDAGKCLSSYDAIKAGSPVELVDLDANDPGQQWERSGVDSLGYFTLRNSNSGKFLNALDPSRLILEGM